MALIRADIQSRHGDVSIYDGVVEFASDFENEKLLDTMNVGSAMICLNLGQNGEDSQQLPDHYIKVSDGSWQKVGRGGGSMHNIMQALIGQKLLGPGSGVAGGQGGGSSEQGTNYGSFIPVSDTYEPAPISVRASWTHMTIWTESTAFSGQRNICGAILWKDGAALAYRVFYTNSSGTSGLIGEALSGGDLFTLTNGAVTFHANVSVGVYRSGVTYHWIAW